MPLREQLSLEAIKNPVFDIFVYNVIQAVLNEALAPVLTEIRQAAFSARPNVELSPEELAEMVVRGIMDRAEAIKRAVKSGADELQMDYMIRLRRNIPSLGEILRAYRLGLIPRSSGDIDQPGLVEAIRRLGLSEAWVPILEQLSLDWPSPTEILDAVLEGQISEEEGRALYARLGGHPDFFDLLFATRGTAPTPTQAAEMAMRGIIPWEGRGMGVVSYEQAFLEGPWRNKWMDAFRKLAEYIPPPRTITAMYREGSISRERAAELLRKQGVPPDLIESYLTMASRERTAADRDLAKSEIISLYEAQAIAREQAQAMLVDLGYDEQEAEFLLALADYRMIRRIIDSAITRIRTLYVNHRIDENEALLALDQLGIPANQRDMLISTWQVERALNIRTLTPSEIRRALRRGLIDEATAINKLMALGYNQEDAMIYIQL